MVATEKVLAKLDFNVIRERLSAHCMLPRAKEMAMGLKAEADIREEPVIMMEKGSVILFKTRQPLSNALDYFEKLNGIGKENENGFGDFVFYFGGVTQ